MNNSPDDALLASQLLIYAQELAAVYAAERHQQLQLQDANRRLQEIDLSKNSFVQLLSHELRTPVAVIAGYIEILNELLEERLESVEAGFLNTVYSQTQHLSELIQQLTEFNQFNESNSPAQLPSVLTDCDLACIVRSELQEIEAVTAEKRLELQLQIPAVLVLANIEPTRFRLIARYLLNNAVKFNAAAGWISVTLRTEAELKQVDDTSNSLQWVILEIGNSGATIPLDKLNSIFESFRQVEDAKRRHHGGLGIGLTIVRRAVASLKGQVEVRSNTQGTFFTIKLPYHLWEDPQQLREKLQQMQSFTLNYAQDLRELYNVEREKQARLTETNNQLRQELTKVLEIQASQQSEANVSLQTKLLPKIAALGQLLETQTNASIPFSQAKTLLQELQSEVQQLLGGLQSST